MKVDQVADDELDVRAAFVTITGETGLAIGAGSCRDRLVWRAGGWVFVAKVVLLDVPITPVGRAIEAASEHGAY